MAMNPIKVRIVLKNGDHLSGEVNIMEFKRFSDFIETHSAKHIKLFNIVRDSDYSDVLIDFLLIPKENIHYYEPFDEKKSE
jgi:hypothetical protein